MFELVYCSVASENLAAEDIDDVLITSRRFNKANDITGCLLYFNGQFLQVLEGKKAVVQELFGKIKKDKRHKNVLLLSEEIVKKRIFENWSMAYCEYDEKASDFKSYLFRKNFIAFSNLAEKPTHTIRLFFHTARQMLEEGFYKVQN